MVKPKPKPLSLSSWVAGYSVAMKISKEGKKEMTVKKTSQFATKWLLIKENMYIIEKKICHKMK